MSSVEDQTTRASVVLDGTGPNETRWKLIILFVPQAI